MAVNLEILGEILEASLDPSKNKQGERALPNLRTMVLISLAELAMLQEEKKRGFSIALLQIVAAERFSSTARLASALYFKNFIKKVWTVGRHSITGTAEGLLM